MKIKTTKKRKHTEKRAKTVFTVFVAHYAGGQSSVLDTVLTEMGEVEWTESKMTHRMTLRIRAGMSDDATRARRTQRRLVGS